MKRINCAKAQRARGGGVLTMNYESLIRYSAAKIAKARSLALRIIEAASDTFSDVKQRNKACSACAPPSPFGNHDSMGEKIVGVKD